MASGWPVFTYQEWRETCDTLHAHTQVLGKLAAKLAPPEPQLQHAALRLTARGWETAPLPAPDGSGALVVALDLHLHEAVVAGSRDELAGDPQPLAYLDDPAVGSLSAAQHYRQWSDRARGGTASRGTGARGCRALTEETNST